MLLGLLIALMVLAWAGLFFHPPAWFPDSITSAGRAFDGHLWLTLAVLGIAFVLAHLLLVRSLFRRQRKAPGFPPNQTTRRETVLEIAWTVCTAGVFLILAFTGARVWASKFLDHPSLSPPNQPETIEVYAHQFAWSFRYPGPDGKFGKTDISLINDAAANPLGIDERDAAAQDDRVTATLRVPTGRDVLLLLHARDVIHDFFVRELRVKSDIVPGMEIPYRFRADHPGQYEIACSELCGLGHSQMRSTMQVMPAAEYDRWKRSPVP